MRLSIRNKLFLTLLVATTGVVVAMYGFMRWSFQHGFVDLMEHRQHERAQRIATQLADVYAAEGGWQSLSEDSKRRRKLLGGPYYRPGTGRGVGRGRDMELDMSSRGMDFRPHGFRGLSLLDADQRRLIGPPVPADKLVLTPVQSQERIVGYVGYLPGGRLDDLLDRRFADAQRRAFILIALLVGVVSAALAWPLASTLVRPLARITAGARALAAGRFQTRVEVNSGDELGDLAHDFNDMAQTLEQTEHARRQWMADISHELRTPLALMRAELEALQDGVRPLDATSVSALHSDVERMSRLVEDLYQLSMTDLGAMSYHKRSVDPLALLADDVEGMMGEFERKGLAITFRQVGDETATLQADPDRLSQLYRNLMQNSLRYTNAPGRLEIVAAVQDGRLELDFADTAPGVPEAVQPHLFDRFFRVETSRSRASGGAGLGLAICRNIVDAHNGRIEARSSPLGGLNIQVALPLAG